MNWAQDFVHFQILEQLQRTGIAGVIVGPVRKILAFLETTDAKLY